VIERYYDEENGVGGFGSDGGIDGVFEFTGKHVFIKIFLNGHFYDRFFGVFVFFTRSEMRVVMK
jgi:hypothetical protein